MNPSSPSNREKEIFEQALDLPSAEARQGYLKGACGADGALLARVQTLLRAHDESGGFLPENPAAAPSPTAMLASAESAERPGTIIGRYKLLEKIGEGGFGSVYMAAQEEPVRRRVALKVIKLGMDTREVVARFEAERQALAMMDHPNIAKVLDGGATENGRPYFVMELVKGVPITTYCDKRQLSTRTRLELFILVCQAVQHAHQKGIIHRDLKPSNILVTEQDDRPVPKVIDFGVARATQARLTEKTMFTQFQQIVGTPAYMSPEQTGLANLDIDTRSDIYSLGVLLYELLTGGTPFDSKKLLEAGYEGIMRTIREVEPPKPSTRLSTLTVEQLTQLGGQRHEDPRRLGRRVEGDLDWIVMKALEKDRSRRYETATSLAADLHRHLQNEPVVARPPGSAYVLRKFVRRHRIGFTAGLAVSLAIVVGATVATWQAVRATRAERATQKEAAKSRQIAQLLEGMLGEVGPSVARGRDTKLLKDLLDQTSQRVAKDLAGQPEVQAELSDTLGWVYYQIAEGAAAEAMFRRELALQRKLHGDRSLAVAEAQRSLAWSLMDRSDATESEKLLRESLALHRALQGPVHDDVAVVLYGLTSALERRGDYRAAAAAAREAIAIRRKLFGSENLEVAVWLDDFSNVMNRAGRPAEGEAMRREALAIRRKLLGNENAAVAQSLTMVAGSLNDHGAYAQAEALLREALAIERRQPVAEQLNFYSVVLKVLANVRAERGDFVEAEALDREALAFGQNNFSPSHWSLASSHRQLADVLKKRGDLTGAEAECRRELAITEQAGGRETLDYTAALGRLADVLQARGDLAEADTLGREALAIRRQLYGADSVHVIDPLRTLASGQARPGNLAEAIAFRREALAIARRKLDPNDRVFSQCLVELSADLRAHGDYAEAEVLTGEAWQVEQALNYFRADQQRDIHENFAKLYATWAKADPTKAALAADWRRKLEAFNAAARERATAL